MFLKYLSILVFIYLLTLNTKDRYFPEHAGQHTHVHMQHMLCCCTILVTLGWCGPLCDWRSVCNNIF